MLIARERKGKGQHNIPKFSLQKLFKNHPLVEGEAVRGHNFCFKCFRFIALIISPHLIRH